MSLALGMPDTSFFEEQELIFGQVVVPTLAQLTSQHRAACAVTWIVPIVPATRIVKQRKEPHESGPPRLTSPSESVLLDPPPMPGTWNECGSSKPRETSSQSLELSMALGITRCLDC